MRNETPKYEQGQESRSCGLGGLAKQNKTGIGFLGQSLLVVRSLVQAGADGGLTTPAPRQAMPFAAMILLLFSQIRDWLSANPRAGIELKG
jgi:hypothetical protein